MLAERLQREPLPTFAGDHLHGYGGGRRFESARSHGIDLIGLRLVRGLARGEARELVGRHLRHMKLDHEQCDRDRKHGVAEEHDANAID
jgi:hypothetical protein